MSLGSGKVIIHVSKSGISYRLYTVQMLHSRSLNILRRRILLIDLGLNTGLMNIGIHVTEFLLGNINIHSAQHGNHICHCSPVKGGIVFNIQIQVFIESRNRLFRTSIRIGLVNLSETGACCQIQIGVTEYGSQLNFSRTPVDANNNLHIRIGTPAYSAVTGVYTENGNSPVALHLLLLFDIDIVILNVLCIKLHIRLDIHVANHITGTENHNQSENFDNGNQKNLLPQRFLLFILLIIILFQLFLYLIRRIHLQNIQRALALLLVSFLGKSIEVRISFPLSLLGKLPIQKRQIFLPLISSCRAVFLQALPSCNLCL